MSKRKLIDEQTIENFLASIAKSFPIRESSDEQKLKKVEAEIKFINESAEYQANTSIEYGLAEHKEQIKKEMEIFERGISKITTKKDITDSDRRSLRHLSVRMAISKKELEHITVVKPNYKLK